MAFLLQGGAVGTSAISPSEPTDAQSRAGLVSPRVRVPYIARWKISSATAVRGGALQLKGQCYPVAYVAGKAVALTSSTMTAVHGNAPVRELAPRADPHPSYSMDLGGIQESNDVHTVRR